MVSALLVPGGLALCAWGVVTAIRAARPRNLAGALAAAVGLAAALLGATRWLLPGFF